MGRSGSGGTCGATIQRRRPAARHSVANPTSVLVSPEISTAGPSATSMIGAHHGWRITRTVSGISAISGPNRCTQTMVTG